MKQEKDIIIFGIQWSGKWTQSTLIRQEYPEYFAYESGDIIRAMTKIDGPVGDYFKGVKKWNLIDNSTICAMFDMYTTILSEDNLMLLDGFPRSYTQMYHVLAYARKTHRKIMGIYLDINKNTAIDRLLNRYYVEKEWHLYPILSQEIDEAKDHGFKIVKRDDDNEEAIRHRIESYFQETMPVIRHFEDIGLLYRVNADQPIDDVFAEIKKIIDEKVIDGV